MDLNKLNAKLLKAEMRGDEDSIEEFKRKIAEFKRDQVEIELRASKNGKEKDQLLNKDNAIKQLNDELNRLSAKLIKAEMLGNNGQIEEYKRKVEEANRKLDEQKNNQSRMKEIKVKLIEESNKLNAKLIKAEMLGNKDQIEEYKRKIEKLKGKQVIDNDANNVQNAQHHKIKKEPKEEFINLNVYYSELFANLIVARLSNDRLKMISCEDKIRKFEEDFNFNNKDDLIKIIKISTVCLEETMNLKSKEEMNGNLELVNDLDKRAKAIRKKNTEYKNKFDELIATLKLIKQESSVDQEKSNRNESTRVHPLYPKPKEEKTIIVIKKLNENGMSLQQMFVNERNSGQDSEDKQFMNASARIKNENDEYEDDVKRKRIKTENDEFKIVVQNDEDKCDMCLDKIKQQLIVTFNDKLLLIVPERKPLLDNQLILRSYAHCPSLVSANEDVVAMINQFKQKLCALFETIQMKLIFIEYYVKHQAKWNPHFQINCYPIKESSFEESKMYFKKGISDTESEWTINKKLIFLKEKPINKSIPNGLSYFCVTFGPTNDGFAHVIENHNKFSKFFGEEVVGGLCNIEPECWRKPKLQSFTEQEERKSKLKKLWSRFDITTK